MIVLSQTERDAFDTLFDHAPDKLNVVKKVWWICMNISHIDMRRRAWPHIFSADSDHLR